MKKMVILSLFLLVLFPVMAEGKSETASSTGSGIKVSKPGVLPITQEMVELSVFMRQDQFVSDYEDNDYTRWLQEATNVKVNFQLAPSSDISQKINLLLASNANLPDVFLSAGLGNDLLSRYGEQDMFLELNGMIKEHMPVFNDILAELKDLQIEKQISMPDGRIFALPRINTGCVHCEIDQKLFVNDMFLKAYGKGTPETVDEFKDFLTFIRDNDVNGNGDASDEIPLLGNRNGWGGAVWDFIMNSFMFYDKYQKGFYLEKGEIATSFTTAEWREGLKYLNGLTEKGLLDATTFTIDDKQHRQIYFQNDKNTIGAWGGGSFAAYRDPKTLILDYTAIPPLTGPKGQKYSVYRAYKDLETGGFAITTACEIPEVAIKWADFQLTEESLMRGRYGLEGRDWNKAPDGMIGASGEQAIYTVSLQWNTIQNAHWHEANLRYQKPKWALGEAITDDPVRNYPFMATKMAREVYSAYNPPLSLFIPPLTLTSEEYDEVGDLITTINDYMLESVARFVTGSLDIDKDWDAYLAEFDMMGLDRVKEVYQTAYNRQWK